MEARGVVPGRGQGRGQRNAAVLPFGIVYFVYGIIASMAVGLACTPFAKKIALDDLERR